MRLVTSLLLVVVVGAHAASFQLGYQGVMACLFELADVNHDAQLNSVELQLVLRRWLSTAEQVADGLTVHRVMAACDTDNSQQVSWAEIIEEPRCLTLAQTEGIAKWMCSRARHGTFAFDEYAQLAATAQRGLLGGGAMRSIKSDFQALAASQTDARRAALARRLGQPRLSDAVDSFLTGFGKTASKAIAFPIAAIIVVFALVIACIA